MNLHDHFFQILGQFRMSGDAIAQQPGDPLQMVLDPVMYFPHQSIALAFQPGEAFDFALFLLGDVVGDANQSDDLAGGVP